VLAVIRSIDTLTRWSAYVFASLTAILTGAIVYNVVMRYFFASPTRWAYDVSYMLYGTLFMMGAAYTLYRQGHIRTDFLYQRWSPRWQGIIDAVFYTLLFLPAMILFFQAGYDYAARSWALGERGYLTTWRPPLYPFKTVIPVAIALLIIQGVSELLKSLYAAVKGRWP
jgi:TRAP-type mannitol/chloroaromatic compound transport system permease small subunit